MKRALAERAKQSGLRNGLGGPTTTTTTSSSDHSNVATDAPPLKIPRITAEAPSVVVAPEKTGALISLPEEAGDRNSSRLTVSSAPTAPGTSATTETKIVLPSPASTTVSSATSSSTTSGPTATAAAGGGGATPRGGRGAGGASMKRQRTSQTNALTEKTEESENFSAFYLKHQNTALASELKALRYQMLMLEKERDFRRNQCLIALQSLQSLDATWTQMETALQLGEAPPSVPQMRTSFRSTDPDEPRSTGVGTSVELVGALLDSLAALGSPQKLDTEASISSQLPLSPPDDLDSTEVENLSDLQRISFAISRRATLLQQWIWTLLQKLQITAAAPDGAIAAAASAPPTTQNIFDNAALYKEISELQSQCRDYEAQIDELSKARDDLTESERKVRRGLYRIATGRMKLEEVLKAIEESDEEGSATAAWMEGPLETLNAATTAATFASSGGTGDEAVDNALVAQIKQQLADTEEVALCREKKIQEMLAEREEFIKKINQLCLPVKDQAKDERSISDDDVKQSTLFIEASSKLVNAERQVDELRAKLEETREMWASSRGDADLALKSLRELEETTSRRLIELTGVESLENIGETDANLLSSEAVQQAQQIVQLEHKLTQALENVRQAEFARQSLTEALQMNDSLQSKLDDLKAKYAGLLASRTPAGRSSVETLPTSSSSAAPSSSNALKEKSASKEKAPAATESSAATANTSAPTQQVPPTERGDRNEKLHRDYRRLRKELDATRASKEAAKAKIERTEKERDTLIQTNSRLLKQSTEKDDMNAKSLSTILHLKHLTEQLTKEKENLELQAKSAGQLALSARLAANAKERVAEEISKEKEALERSLDALRERCSLLDQEKEAMDGNVSQLKGEIQSLASDLAKAKCRCDELAGESTKQEAEKQKMAEALAVAQRQTAEAVKNLANLTRQSGGTADGVAVATEFTAEQLSTQVAVLKGRLACPVCNHRDKKCILMRCRHMFCKHCVEENLKNRSRKCPACGQAFGAKDVHDVWL